MKELCPSKLDWNTKFKPYTIIFIHTCSTINRQDTRWNRFNQTQSEHILYTAVTDAHMHRFLIPIWLRVMIEE